MQYSIEKSSDQFNFNNSHNKYNITNYNNLEQHLHLLIKLKSYLCKNIWKIKYYFFIIVKIIKYISID